MLLSTMLLSSRLTRGLRNLEKRRCESETVLRKDSEWSVIDGALCRVTSFDALGSLVDRDGKVHAVDKTSPLACVTIECRRLGKNLTGYITHTVDFRNLWEAFEETRVNEDEEVLIIWTKEHYRYRLMKFLSPLFPKLLVMVCPKGAYELMVDNGYRPELSGQARGDAMRRIVEWKPEVMQ